MKTNFGKRASGLAALCGLLVLASSCNGNSNTWSIQGVTGPTLADTSNGITITTVFQNVTADVTANVQIPDMPNSTIQVTSGTGGLTLLITMATADIDALGAVTSLPPQDLPGGAPLPGVSGGQLPALAVQVPQLDNVTFYVGNSVFGVFVPVGFDIGQLVGSYDYYDSANALRGQISLVSSATAGDSGFLLLLNWAVPNPNPSSSPIVSLK